MTLLNQSAPPSFAALDAKQCADFHANGFLGPFSMLDRDHMLSLHQHIDAVLATQGSDAKLNHNRHIDDELIFDIARHPAVINKIRSLVGEDVLLWRTNFFTKEPGGKEIPWHQDYNYWPIEPAIVVSAWLAIDDVDPENSNPQFIPGSHRRIRRHVSAPETMMFHEMADPDDVPCDEAQDMTMHAGQFVLFNERTLHHSFANNSQRRRMGLALRYIVPQVRVMDWDSEAHVLHTMSGGDPLGFNKRVSEPVTRPNSLL